MVGPDGGLRFAPKLFLFAFLLALVVGAVPARAQVGSDRYSSMVIDSQTGQVMSAANPDDYRFPASLTKMMTIYMVFEAIRDRRLSFTDMVPMSTWAASMPPTKMGIPPGASLSVHEALLALVTKSANDVAAALGELLGGSEERFAELMTVRARGLGMTHTTFRNASGLPDWGQVTTARDMVILARHLIQDFPQYYQLFSTPYFQFHGRTVLNHQALLRTYPGADGLKTGYTEASGYNVVTSATRGNVRLIGVVLGASSGGERDGHMAALLDQGFQRMGVAPVEVARHEPIYRLPLVGAARAAPMPAFAEAPVRTRVTRERGAAVRGRRVIAPAYAAVPRAAPPPVYAPARSRGATRRKPAPRSSASRQHVTRHAGKRAEKASRVAHAGKHGVKASRVAHAGKHGEKASRVAKTAPRSRIALEGRDAPRG